MPIAGNGDLDILNRYEAIPDDGNNQVATRFTMPEDGDVTSLSCYFAGDGVSILSKLVLWDGNGNILRQSSYFIQPSGRRIVRGQHWGQQNITPIRLNKGQQFYVGFWRGTSWGHLLGYQFTDEVQNRYVKKAAGSGPTSMQGANQLNGRLCMYIEYRVGPQPTTGGIKVYNGTSFPKHPVKVWDGTRWIWRPVRTWDGSSWKRRG